MIEGASFPDAYSRLLRRIVMLPQSRVGSHERNTLNWQLSAFDRHNVRLNLAVDSTPPEPLGDGFSCDVGRFAKPRFVPRLDLAS